MRDPITLGRGVMPDVCATPDGWVTVYREPGKTLWVVWLTRDGAERGRMAIPTTDQPANPATLADSTFPRLCAFAGDRWFAYRANRRGAWWAVVREVLDLRLGDEVLIGGVHPADSAYGNCPVCLSPDGWFAWQDAGTGTVEGLRLGGDWVGHTLHVGFKPTGLARCDGGVIVFVDDVRFSVPGMTNPVSAGACTVGEHATGGIRVRMLTGQTGVLLAGDTFVPRIADGGASTYAAVTWGPAGVQCQIFTPADLTEPPFSFAPFDHPVLIAPFAAKGSGAPDITSIGFYSEAVEPTEVIAMAAAAGTRLVLVHDAATSWAFPAGLRPWDLPMLEIYRLADESLAASGLRWHVQIAGLLTDWPGDIGLVPQFYGQGGVGPDELWSVAEILAGLTYLSALVNLSPRIKIVAPFAYNRANGITAHPELRAAFDALLKATPGPPALLPIGRTPPPPPPQVLPPEVKAPSSPPIPEGDFLMFSVFTDPTKKVLAVKAVKALPGGTSVLENPDGRIVSIQPDGSVQDRDPGADGGYERCKISGNAATFKPVDGKYFTFAFVVVDGL